MKFIKEINGKSRMAAVIGSPIHHSKSPLIYNSCFEMDNLNIVYLAFETSQKETISRIEALKNLNVSGINITMPGKLEAIKCVDRLDLAAQYVQAVNMIVLENNEWVGYNTDGEGFWNAVKAHHVMIKSKKVTIFGSGNTTRVILTQAVLEGVSEVNVIARNIERPLEIKTVIAQLKSDYPNTKISLIDLGESEKVQNIMINTEILVQTTSVGMSPNPMNSILENEDWLNPNCVVCDIVYDPRKTLLMHQAEAKGCKIIGGIEMLVHQAALNYTLITGLKMNTEKILNIMNKNL